MTENEPKQSWWKYTTSGVKDGGWDDLQIQAQFHQKQARAGSK